MTASVIIAGFMPIMWSHGADADVMKRIALPIIGGVVTPTVMELVVYPAIFHLWRSRQLKLGTAVRAEALRKRNSMPEFDAANPSGRLPSHLRARSAGKSRFQNRKIAEEAHVDSGGNHSRSQSMTLEFFVVSVELRGKLNKPAMKE